MTLASRGLSMTVNGRTVGPMDVPDDMMMLDFLHEFLNLTGSRMGCGQGICHACTVAVAQPDGSLREMRTCITGAHFFAGRSVHTVEGWAERDPSGSVVRLSPVQQAFIEHYAFQCGYCTPGFVTGATVLMDQLKRAPVSRKDLERVIEDALGPHICRCTGYVRYYAAVRQLIVDTPGLIAR